MTHFETILHIVKFFSLIGLFFITFPLAILDSLIGSERTKEKWDKLETGISYKGIKIIGFLLGLIAGVTYLILHV